jgi:FixJ family two-component response regulator
MLVESMAREDQIICVIDDAEAVRDSLKLLLELESFTVQTFETCEDFLAWLPGNDALCLVLDLHLPGMSGFELLEHLIADGQTFPTILMTGRSDRTARQQAEDLGALTLLDKPIEFARLIEALDRATAD